MKSKNPLDLHMERNKKIPYKVREAVLDIADTLDIAWLATQAVFEDKATPEMALAVFDRIQFRISSLDSSA